MTTRLTFPSGGERCAAWLTLPQAASAASRRAADPWRRRHPRHDARPVRALVQPSGLRRARLRFPPSRRIGRRAAPAHESRPLFPGHRRGAGLHPHQARARCRARGAVGHVVRCQPRRGDGGAPPRHRCRRHPMPDPAGPRAGAERRPRPSAALHRPDRLRPFARDAWDCGGATCRSSAGRASSPSSTSRAPTTAGCPSCPRA